MDSIQVPARIPRDMIDKVRTKMKGQGLNWAALVSFLFRAYLDGKVTIDVASKKV